MLNPNNWSNLPQRVESRLPELYALVALAVGLLVCVVTAPFFGADEPVQSLRAMSLGHGVLVGRMIADTDEPGADVDVNARAVMSAIDDVRMRWESQAGFYHDRSYGPMAGAEALQRKLAGERWARHSEFLGFGNTIVYPPVLYGPSVVGWRLGEAANLTILQSLRLARVLDLLVAVMLGWLALRMGVGFRWSLLGYLVLPSVLFVEAGCSQDAVMLAVSAVVAALVARAIVGRRAFTRGELVALAVMIGACGMARLPYVALGLVVFVPQVELRLRRCVGPWLAFAAIVLSCWLWRHLVAPLGLDSSDEADPVRQAAFVRAHFGAALGAVARGTWEAAVDFWHRGLYVVGWNDLLPHHGLEIVLGICLLTLVVFASGIRLSWRARALVAAAIALSLLGISAAEYVIWTPVGLGTVYGIQPRYWLPCLPLALLALQMPTSQRRAGWARLAAAGGMVAVALTLPVMCAHAFYRAGVWEVVKLNLGL